MLDAPAASLGSENCRVKSAVEMTPRRRLYIFRKDQKSKNETENQFQLADLGQFKDHENQRRFAPIVTGYYASEIPIKIRSESAQWRRFERCFGGDLA